MDTQKIKWFQSKAVWAGVIAVLISAYATAASQFGLPAIPEWVFGILGAMGVYSRVVATNKIG